MTREIEPGRSPFIACSYARSRPEPIAVEPPDVRSSIAARMRSRFSIPVGSSTTRVEPAYVTSETESRGPRLFVRIRSDCCASPSLSAEPIEPETSTRNTRCAGLRSASVFAFVATPTRRIWRSGDSGDGAASITTENGEPAAGAGNAYLK